MVDIGRDDHAAAGDFVAHQFRGEFFPLGDVEHLLGDQALAGVMHLREVAVFVVGCAASQPFRAGLGNCAVTASIRVGAGAGRTIRRGHGVRILWELYANDYTLQK